ncbi:MAG: fused MFS/spermidine synthase [bacterium]
MKSGFPLLSRFVVAIFLGAFLLFQIQPLIARYVLPWFGGGPSVWTACMLFFQCLLVGGYAYSHWLSRLQPRRQAVLHVVLLLISLPFLPIIPGDGWKPGAAEDPTFRILLLLACTVGLPFFVLSTTSPLIQSWFGRSFPNVSPYRLFALSNTGALIALVSYPVVVEPGLTLRMQAISWSIGYVCFAMILVYCALRMWRTSGAAAGGDQQSNDGDTCEGAAGEASGATGIRIGTPETMPDWAANPNMLVKILWAALPACGSVLLLAVTNQLCWDVSVVPFLWVLPLAIYLLSFILCFQSTRWYFRPLFGPLLIGSIMAMIGLASAGVRAPIWLQIGGFSASAFVCFMVCHGEMALLKPSPKHLTLYYLMLAVGGAAGGIFVGIAAPRMFTGYSEMQIGLWACFVLSMISVRFVRLPYTSIRFKSVARLSAVFETLTVVTVGFILYAHAHVQPAGQLSASRNFYGSLKVMRSDTKDPARKCLSLQHGRIKHGSQFESGRIRSSALSYYGGKSGFGMAFKSLNTNLPMRVGILGLGVGTIAAFGRQGDLYRFYEINPNVIRVASEYFTYIRDCPAKCEIVEGDGRMSMERETIRDFDLLAIDAFTSDAIPVHLLTREAVVLYLSHLKASGILALNISNRYLDLEGTLQALAADLGISIAVIRHTATDEDKTNGLDSSTWVLLTRDRDVFARDPILSASRRARRAAGRLSAVWTDDYNDLFMTLLTRNQGAHGQNQRKGNPTPRARTRPQRLD